MPNVGHLINHQQAASCFNSFKNTVCMHPLDSSPIFRELWLRRSQKVVKTFVAKSDFFCCFSLVRGDSAIAPRPSTPRSEAGLVFFHDPVVQCAVRTRAGFAMVCLGTFGCLWMPLDTFERLIKFSPRELSGGDAGMPQPGMWNHGRSGLQPSPGSSGPGRSWPGKMRLLSDWRWELNDQNMTRINRVSLGNYG